MREYETIIVLDPTIGDTRVDEEIDRIQNMVTSRDGEIVAVEKWGRRKLAYEVKKKKEGIYALIRFKGNSEILSELEHRYRLNEQMLRHLTVVSEGPPPAPPEEHAAAARGEGAAAPESAPASGAAPAAGGAPETRPSAESEGEPPAGGAGATA